MPMGLALKQLVAFPAGSLDGLQWVLHNTGPPSGPGFGPCDSNATVTATMGGDSSIAYNVTLRFRGVVEEKTYTGGTNDGAFWQVGGTPDTGPWNIYRLTISNPSTTYYLNRGASGLFHCFAIDYQKTITINGGATVTLYADSVPQPNPEQVWNSSTDPPTQTLISIPGITSPAQPFDGQFIQMDVISVS